MNNIQSLIGNIKLSPFDEDSIYVGDGEMFARIGSVADAKQLVTEYECLKKEINDCISIKC